MFTAVGDVLGEPVTLFYAQNGYGGTGQLIADLLSRAGVIRWLRGVVDRTAATRGAVRAGTLDAMRPSR